MPEPPNAKHEFIEEVKETEQDKEEESLNRS
jgi:hypothetical protein